MKKLLLAVLAFSIVIFASSVRAADGVAFVTNLSGEVTVDGAPRPLLMSELAKGQRIVVGKDALLAVMFIQSGKEYLLKGAHDYVVGEREITSSSGIPPATRETTWRASNEVLVKVAQTSSASIRMRSFAPPPKADAKPKLEFPVKGAVTTLQPTLRWTVPDAKSPVEVAIAVVGKEEKPLARATVNGASHRFPAKLQPDTEYSWKVSQSGREIGSARFNTLSASVMQDAQRRRPADKAEFSDRLMYAVLLQDIGAVQEAQEAWARLAQERADLPELASLAK